MNDPRSDQIRQNVKEAALQPSGADFVRFVREFLETLHPYFEPDNQGHLAEIDPAEFVEIVGDQYIKADRLLNPREVEES